MRHFKNGCEVRLDERALSVDRFGVSTSTAYQFHGWFWHEHPCAKTAGVVNPCRSFTERHLNEMPTCLAWAVG